MSHVDPRYAQYEQWVRAYSAELYRFAHRLSGTRETAEDLVQETFAEAWRSLTALKQPDHPRAWLFQILRYRYAHLIRDHGHHLKASHSEELLDAQPAPAIIPPLETLANQEALQLALNTLTPQIRETFLLVFLQENTCREVAEQLHIPLGTVLSRLDRARQLLRAALREPVAAPAGIAVPKPESPQQHG